MKTRIYNARILTMVPDSSGNVSDEIIHGEVRIHDGVITYVGDGLDVKEAWDKEIDAKGNLIMPGFKNAHTHSPMTFLRSYADDLALHEWLHNYVFPAEAKLVPEDGYWLTRLAVLEYLTSGVTTTFDMYYLRDEVARGFSEAKFRNVFCDTVMDVSGSLEEMEADYLRFNKDNSLLNYRFGFHGEYTTSKELIEKIVKLARQYHAPIFTHCCETIPEVESCLKRNGVTPVAYLDSLGVFDNGGGIFHGVVIEDKDFDILKRHNIYVVTNPASNLKISSGIAPINEYLKRGINVAIGTDGPASNNALDMFREMYLTTTLQKVVTMNPEVVPAMEVLKMAINNGAHIMGIEDCDSLAVGKKADIIMIDLNQPNMQPLQNIAKNLVFSGSKSNVKMTMVNGEVLYMDGKFYQDISAEEKGTMCGY